MSNTLTTFARQRVQGFRSIQDTLDEIDAQAEQEAIEENDVDDATETTRLVTPQKTFGLADLVLSNAGRGAMSAATGAQGALANVSSAASAVHAAGIASAAGTAAATLSPAAPVGAAVNAAQAIADGMSTDNQLVALRELQRQNAERMDDVDDALSYAIRKLTDRRRRAGLSFFSGGASTIFSKGRALKKIAKRTKGVERSNYAQTLWTRQMQNDELAGKICQILLGPKKFGELRNDPLATENGWVLLKRALSSTN